MKAEDAPRCEAMPVFLELLVDKLLKAIGCCERVDRTPTATHGFAGGIVKVDDADPFHLAEAS